MRNFIQKAKNWIHPSHIDIFAYVASFVFFVVNARYVAYPDEFVNLLGGLAILHGKVPYNQFFDHHLPLAWVLAALFLLFSFGKFTLFRIWWSVFAFVCLALVGKWLKKHYREIYPYFLVFLVFYPLLGVYFWLHLYIADALAALFFSLTFWIILPQTLTKRVNEKSIIAASLLTFCLIFSSLTYLYLALALYAWQVFLIGWNPRKLARYAIISIAPYLLFGLYLLISNSWRDFYFANVIYNRDLYVSIPNYVRGHLFNPLKFAMTIIFNFYNSYLPLLSKIKYFDIYLPIGTLAGLGTLSLFLLLLHRRFWYGILFFFILSFSAPRSDIQNYKETDYQGAFFLVFGLISALAAIYLMRKYKFEEVIFEDIKRVSQFLLVVFMFFSFIFLLHNTYGKFFLRYTQQMPSITNVNFTSQFIDSMVDGDYYWIGPYEPDQEFFVKQGKLPGKYPTLLPQFRENDYLKTSFINQFEQNPPRIIIYKQTASVFNTPALVFGKFFIDWMSGKYTLMEKIKGINYVKTPTEFNIKSDLYLRNDQKDQLLQKLRDQGYIE